MKDLNIGDTCKVKHGIYKDAVVKIESLPDKDDTRCKVSRDGFSGLRLKREILELLEEDKKG